MAIQKKKKKEQQFLANTFKTDEMYRYSGEEIQGGVQIPQDPCLIMERVRDASAVFSDFLTRFFRRLI